MTRVVLDASAALRLVLGHGDAPAIGETLAAADQVVAPRLYVAETANALWKYVASGHLDETTALERLDEALQLVEHDVEDRELAAEALSLAARRRHPVYDALYAVLGRRLVCPVVTRDGRLRTLLAEIDVDAA